ncbi:ankyrin repeat domain-containing protein 60 isoform X2 [Mus caroli]|uniref:Ankyrin repeat domain-containing protein 60 isoform X2 n=1 Tax=Mus caroli TaxID=10089 RepID=A0A6P5PF40_MUSCR|nr:ankyrin repeat domain-containing protein 60 isoform X2 [Mus caroli]
MSSSHSMAPGPLLPWVPKTLVTARESKVTKSNPTTRAPSRTAPWSTGHSRAPNSKHMGILMDDATLKFYDVIPGALISLCIWHYDGWTELVLAAVEGDPSKMSCLGISEDTFYRTANSQHFKGEQWRQWTAQRAFVALYISAHRGHVDAVQYLLGLGANCLAKSPLGRTPLHVVAAMGRTDCVQPLLEHGASIHDRDLKSDTPITIARRLKRGHLERKMFLLYWMIKSGSRDPDLVARKALEKSSPGVETRRSTILIS